MRLPLLQILSGFKTTIVSLLLSVTTFIIVYKFANIWQPWLHIIEPVLYALLVLVVIFSAQFNRSRLSLISLLWLAFYFSLDNSMLWHWPTWLITYKSWLLLTGAVTLLTLGFIKDRGLFSIHSAYRLLLLVLCATVAWFWLYASEWLLTYLVDAELNNQVIKEYTLIAGQYLSIDFPLVIVALILLSRSLLQTNLFASALFITFIVWCLQHYQWLPLPWSITLTLLATYYLLVVSIDSYFLAYRDELTGLPSRRALNQLALSLGRKYTVAMLDIDHFKKFNDSYGHDIGDQVLKLVAAKLAEVKGGGRVFRYGGEEFTIVFPRKDASHARVELEKLRQAIADYKITIRHQQRKTKDHRKENKNDNFKKVSVTISIGLAVRETKQSFEEALKCSDQALYRAKNNGRNNVSE